MEDVGRAPAEPMSSNAEPATIPTLDGWIESLMTCKQLAEVDVQRLCEKVRFFPSSLRAVIFSPRPGPLAADAGGVACARIEGRLLT